MWTKVPQNGEIMKSKNGGGEGRVNTSSDFKENVFKPCLAIDSPQVEGNIIKRVCSRVVKAQFSQ